METRILIVEDEREFASFLKKVCENELSFLKTDFVENGWEALKLLVADPGAYSLAVIDIDMTPIAGDDLVTIIGILNRYNITKLKTIIMSGKVSKRPGDYLEKPFSPEEFGAAVSEILDRDA
jgi:DNA-binding response OmpR family regulator